MTLTLAGGCLFIPFISAGDPVLKGPALYKNSVIFVLASTCVTALAAWGGLLISDKLNVPMPILRKWELGQPIKANNLHSVVSTALLFGVVAATVVLLGNYFVHPPINPGGLLTRVATMLWASVVTETVSHLFILAGLVLVLKNKWLSLVISGLLFVVLFHLSSGYSASITAYLSLANLLAATLTGYLFLTKGFECAVLTHGVMHFILLAVNR